MTALLFIQLYYTIKQIEILSPEALNTQSMILWTSSIVSWFLLQMQDPGPHRRPAESESAFLRAPQVICVHTKVWEALYGSLWWQVEWAAIYFESYLASELKHETITLI